MTEFSLLILSAGFGKRMLDLTTKLPKPLLKINDQTLLSNTIHFFQQIGCKEFFINTHYLHEKIEIYLHRNFKNYRITLIHEPQILGTGGAVKNIFNYTKNTNLCIVNSDIFWQKNNTKDIINFIHTFENVSHCKILLSKKDNFFGLKKDKGDFNITEGIVSNWTKGKKILFYSGLQIVSKKIFKIKSNCFPMNMVWNDLIKNKNLKGQIMNSNILHIGDKISFLEQ